MCIGLEERCLFQRALGAFGRGGLQYPTAIGKLARSIDVTKAHQNSIEKAACRYFTHALRRIREFPISYIETVRVPVHKTATEFRWNGFEGKPLCEEGVVFT